MVVSPSRGWKSVADVVAAAKASPGQLNYASAGIGSATHLNAEKFKLQASIDAQHIPFKGTPEALNDVIAGRIDWFFAPLSSALPLIQAGKLQALAVSTATRDAAAGADDGRGRRAGIGVHALGRHDRLEPDAAGADRQAARRSAE